MAGIERGPALDGVAARRLAALTPEEAARAIAELVSRPVRGDVGRKALGAVARALLWGRPELSEERRHAIRAAALGLGVGEVVALLTEASAGLTMERDARRPDAELASLTLGHRTQGARTEHNRDRLAR